MKKITAKAVFDIASGELLEWEGYDYDGPLDLCGGGPSATQQAAQAQQLQNSQQEGQLAQQSAGKFNALYGQTQPFYSSEMTNGLPFMNNLTDAASGTTAQAYAPAKASFLRSEASMGALPSGSKAAGMNDINDQQAKTFDQALTSAQMQNFATKQAGAAGLTGLQQIMNPAAFYGGSSQASGSAMQPLQPQQNPWMGMLGGALGQAAKAIPF